MSKRKTTSSTYTYIAFHKPFGVLSQFTREVDTHTTLADYFPNINPSIYPVGRLDKDSEGLLILSDDPKLTDRLLNPKNNHFKTYLVQVEGDVTPQAIASLCSGVTIKLKSGYYQTKPCIAVKDSTLNFPDRIPPIRERKNIPTSWIKISISEGKNRQVRKMCAKVGFPCLRLIRTKIQKLKLGSLQLGDHLIFSLQELF